VFYLVKEWHVSKTDVTHLVLQAFLPRSTPDEIPHQTRTLQQKQKTHRSNPCRVEYYPRAMSACRCLGTYFVLLEGISNDKISLYNDSSSEQVHTRGLNHHTTGPQACSYCQVITAKVHLSREKGALKRPHVCR
jgi:hypothetical protein